MNTNISNISLNFKPYVRTLPLLIFLFKTLLMYSWHTPSKDDIPPFYTL